MRPFSRQVAEPDPGEVHVVVPVRVDVAVSVPVELHLDEVARSQRVEDDDGVRGRLGGADLVAVVLSLRVGDDGGVDVDVGPGAEAALAGADVLGREGQLVDAGAGHGEDAGVAVHGAVGSVHEAPVVLDHGRLGVAVCQVAVESDRDTAARSILQRF